MLDFVGVLELDVVDDRAIVRVSNNPYDTHECTDIVVVVDIHVAQRRKQQHASVTADFIRR